MEFKNVEQFESQLIKVLSSKKFLGNDGLAGEMPLYIYPYPAEQELQAEVSLNNIVTALKKKGHQPLVINLYDLMIDSLKDSNMLDPVFDFEKDNPKGEFYEVLRNAVNIEQVLMPKITQLLDENKFSHIFISGVGQAFPIIRAHSILNHLPAISGDIPVVLFFPGTYERNDINGSSLRLFSKLQDDNYYRARDITKVEV
jgi:hypothetical protein